MWIPHCSNVYSWHIMPSFQLVSMLMFNIVETIKMMATWNVHIPFLIVWCTKMDMYRLSKYKKWSRLYYYLIEMVPHNVVPNRLPRPNIIQSSTLPTPFLHSFYIHLWQLLHLNDSTHFDVIVLCIYCIIYKETKYNYLR